MFAKNSFQLNFVFFTVYAGKIVSGFCWSAVFALTVFGGETFEVYPKPPAPGYELFTNGAIPRIQVEIEPNGMEHLRKAPRKFVRAKVLEGTVEYEEVAVHLKGSVGSFRPIDEKPGITLDFSRFKPGQRFHGLRRIHLNNSLEDPSYLNERIGSELFCRAGVPAARVTRALVELNSRKLGLYVLKEGFTEDFLGLHFKTVGGNLYEPDLGHDVDQVLKRNSVQAPGQDSDNLRALAGAALEPDSSLRWGGLTNVLDTDRFVTFMVMEILMCHRDGYCLARNNFRVYHDVDSGKKVFLPHGMDQLFGKAEMPWEPFMAGIVAKGVMESPEGRRLYDSRFAFLFTNLFVPKVLTNRVDQLVWELRSHLGPGEYKEIEREAFAVKERIMQRQTNLVWQLSQPRLKLMDFEKGIGRLSGWTLIDASGVKAGQDHGTNGTKRLHLAAFDNTAASWRTKALLKRGAYRFEGRGQVAGIVPLPFGIHQGASLRVVGRERQLDNYVDGPGWKNLSAGFQVDAETEEIEFVCELRASAGDVWFDLDSLRVVQIP